MINTNRIVPVSALDLISLYGLILNRTPQTIPALQSSTQATTREISTSRARQRLYSRASPLRHLTLTRQRPAFPRRRSISFPLMISRALQSTAWRQPAQEQLSRTVAHYTRLFLQQARSHSQSVVSKVEYIPHF